MGVVKRREKKNDDGGTETESSSSSSSTEDDDGSNEKRKLGVQVRECTFKIESIHWGLMSYINMLTQGASARYTFNPIPVSLCWMFSFCDCCLACRKGCYS